MSLAHCGHFARHRDSCAGAKHTNDSKAWLSTLSCPTHRGQDNRPTCISARAPESTGAVDAVLQDLLGDFDRVTLPFDALPSDTLTGDSTDVQPAADDADVPPVTHEGEVTVPEVVPQQQSAQDEPWAHHQHAESAATWRTSAHHDGYVRSARAREGQLQFHSRQHAFSKHIAYPKNDADPVRRLFPSSKYSKEQASACKVSAMLCAAQFHDALFDSSILDRTINLRSLKPQLGQHPPKTTTGSGRLRRALQSMDIQIELLTLHYASADDRQWTKKTDLFSVEDDVKILQPMTQHALACWSWEKVKEAIIMVMVKYPGTCRQCLSAAQVNSASDTASANQSSSQSSRSHKNSMFIDKLCGLLRELEEGPPRCPQQPQLELDKTQLLTLQIRRLLQQERQHMAEVEAAAKAALEAELLFCLLENCQSKQNVLECIQSFRWYCGYQSQSLVCVPSRRAEFIALLGWVLSRLAQCEPEDVGVGTPASPHVVQVAGVWITLAERPSPGEQDMHPDASSHLQHYLDNASCDVLMQLTFHEAGSRNNPFSGMSFSHLETIAQALLTCKGKCTRGKHTYSTTLQEATGLLATRLSHRIRFDLKSASPEETAQAANAFACVRLAVWHDPGPKSVQGLCATFKKHLLLTSLAQTTQITAKLLFNLIRALVAGGGAMHHAMMGKLETILQHQVCNTVSSEAWYRLQLMYAATGSPDLISEASVSQQVCKALDVDVDLASCNAPQATESGYDPWVEQHETPEAQYEADKAWLLDQGDHPLSDHGASPQRDKLLELKERNKSFAADAVLAACEHLYNGSLSSNSWHQLVRLMVQHRLNDSMSWSMTGKLMRLANKNGLSGPRDSKKSQEFRQCLELIFNQHARKGGVLYTDMTEQLTALNTLQREQVFSAPLTSAAAQRVHECFAQPSDSPRHFTASAKGCSEALVPALLLQSLSRTFDRYSGKPELSDVQLFLSQIMLEDPATLNEYMKTTIQITKPSNVKHSPDAQRIRAAMISTASNIIPLYKTVSERQTQCRNDSDQRRALNSNVQDIFADMYSTVKHMVAGVTKPHLFDTGTTSPSQQTSEEAESEDSAASIGSGGSASSTGQSSKHEWNHEMWQTASEDKISVYYCLGPLWPLVQLSLADKAIKLRKGTITTMSVMRAALPLLLKSTNVRHITPIVTCMQRYQYINTALYDHVMSLVRDQYMRLCEAQGAKRDNEADPDSQQRKHRYNPRSRPQSKVHEPPSFAVKDKMQKMHVWLISRALRSSYLPGKAIVDIMAERVERLGDRRIKMVVIERYLAMYLDGLPASKATLDGLKRAFMQRKGSWQDFAVASALQLFAERDFRSQDFEREAVKWFERRAAKKVFMRHSLVGALNQTRLLWLLHGHSNFPQYSQELQQAIRGQPRNTTPSPVQLEIFKAVSSVYPGATLEEPACDGQLNVDIAIRYNAAGDVQSNQGPQNVKVAIECDGPHHFFVNTKPYNQTPKTKLRNAMLERDGWIVLQIDTYTWYSTTWHPSSGERQGIRSLFIVDLLKKNGLEHIIPAPQSEKDSV